MSFDDETSQADSALRDRPLIEPAPLRDFTSAIGTWVGEARRQTMLLKQLGGGTQSLAGVAGAVGAALPDASGPALTTPQAAIAALGAAQASLSAAAISRDKARATLAEARASAEQALQQGNDVLLARRVIAILIAFAFCLLVYVTLHG